MVFFPYVVYELPMGPNTTAGATIAEAATTLAATIAANTRGGTATNTTAGAMTTEAATSLAATTAVVSFHVLEIISMVFFLYIVHEPLIGPNTTAGVTTTEAATTLAT